MEAETIKVLLIEDNSDDVQLILRKLNKSVNARFEVSTASSLQQGLEYLDQNVPDLILSDLGLPDSHGLDTLTKLMCKAPQIPLVILSGFDDEAIAIKAVKTGAQDYLVKGQLEGTQIERSLFYAIERARLQRELEQHTQEIWKVQTNLLKILDKNADAIIVVGEGKKILFANPAAESMLGRKKKELLNQTFSFPLNKGKTTEIEIKRQDKEDITAEMNVVGIDWEGNHAFLASLRDVTERKRAQIALQESEEKFSKAFLSSPEAIVISTVEDGTFLEVNDSFCRLTGYTREEIRNHTATDLNIWAYPEQRSHMVKTLKEKGMISNQEYNFQRRNGEICTWLFSAESINFNNQPCLISIATDITERKKTEEALRFSDAAFKSIHESVIATDTQYVITHWNEISEQMYGIKSAEAIGKKLQDVIEIVEEYPGENKNRFKKLETNGYYQEEQLHRTRQGEVWVDVSFQAIESDSKRYGWVILASAITQRKLAEEALKSSEEKYRELISTSIDAIVSFDQNMRIMIWNRGAEKIFGYTENEMLGQSFMKLVPEREHKKIEEQKAEVSRTDPDKVANFILEGFGLKKDHTEIPIELSISSRKTGDNHIVTAILRDITERKEAEEKLRKVDEMKSEFLSNVSHELRTPLQSISGFTKLILDGKVPDAETRQEFLQIIDSETQHLGNLIGSLLDMSRLESGKFEINKKLVSIKEDIVDSLKSFQSLAREKNISLTEDIPANLPEMEVDSERMRQVVINLLSNAIKYSDPGGSVHVKVAKQPDQLIFQVSDNGIGMSKEALKHLFERFYRAEDELVRGGTGLGLYISKQIIEAHGGQIWADSQLNKGSTFGFTLPLNGKGEKGNGKKNPGNRRRPGNIKTGELLSQS
jgi:PAS domain S-box-containing protein